LESFAVMQIQKTSYAIVLVVRTTTLFAETGLSVIRQIVKDSLLTSTVFFEFVLQGGSWDAGTKSQRRREVDCW
jgi:hypothetical protein